jgi:hypothetical protein
MAAMIEETRRERVAAARVADPIEELLLWARYYVDPELHQPLGLTREALAAHPPLPVSLQAGLRRAAQSQHGAARACLPVFVWSDPGKDPERSPAVAWAALSVDLDGRVSDVVVRMAGAARQEDAERCAREAVGRWSFPPRERVGRVWVQLFGEGAEVARRVEEPASGSVPSLPADRKLWSKPAMKDRRCVAQNASLPRHLLGGVSSVLVRFAIERDGRPTRFRALEPADAPIAALAAIEDAVRRCEWIPGADEHGQPVAIWVLLPLRFAVGE